MSEQTRTCTRCHKEKPIADFYQGTRRGKKFHYHVCKICYTTRRSQQRRDAITQSQDTRGLKFLSPRHCGGCGKNLHWPSRNRGNLCNTCSKPGIDADTYIDIYKESMGEHAAVSSCPSCAFVQVCQARVSAHLWVICEMPDQADLDRARLLGIKTDGRQITLRRDQVRDKTTWPGWWGDVVEIGEGQPLTVERVNHESLR